MAAAEARAAWQRMANRCFVQEDAKRAPKLACCPSSLSKLQYDSSNREGANGATDPASNFLPLNWNPTNSDLPPDAKWWLQLQPNFGNHKEFMHEQLNMLENEIDCKTREAVVLPSKIPGERLPDIDNDSDLDNKCSPLVEPPSTVSTTFMKHDCEKKVHELKVIKTNVKQPLNHQDNLNDHWYEGDELMVRKAVDQLGSIKVDKGCFDFEPNWIGEKTEPWWRITNKDELELLVAQKSLEHIENCDLPPPQKVHFSNDPLAHLKSFNDDEVLPSSTDNFLHPGICNQYVQRSSTSESMDKKHISCDRSSYSYYDSEKLYSTTHSYKVTSKTSQDYPSKTDPSKAQLLEALCHSQTRAREAEIAAQKAYNEKEHIIKLFIKQASHLFAYKQWFHLLQLESLCLQLKVKEQQLSTLFPAMPWMPEKEDQTESDVDVKRKGRKQNKCSFCRYIVAFAVGVGLASAGLLLGWLFPAM